MPTESCWRLWSNESRGCKHAWQKLCSAPGLTYDTSENARTSTCAEPRREPTILHHGESPIDTVKIFAMLRGSPPGSCRTSFGVIWLSSTRNLPSSLRHRHRHDMSRTSQTDPFQMALFLTTTHKLLSMALSLTPYHRPARPQSVKSATLSCPVIFRIWTPCGVSWNVWWRTKMCQKNGG
jgi:hypothetical protein